MKKLLATALVGVAVATTASAQGTVNFANYFTGTASDPRVFMHDGTLANGNQYVIALWGGASVATMAQIATTSFLVPGYFNGPTVAIPGVAGGTTGWFQIQVWDATLGNTTTGATYAQAVAYGTGRFADIFGSDTPFQNPTGNPSATPPGLPQDLTGASSFSLNQVPEPTSLALLGLGAAGLAIFRRRK